MRPTLADLEQPALDPSRSIDSRTRSVHQYPENLQRRPRAGISKKEGKTSNMLAYHIVACYIGEETERGTPDVCWEARAVSYDKPREDMVEGLVVFALKRAPTGSIDDCYICD